MLAILAMLAMGQSFDDLAVVMIQPLTSKQNLMVSVHEPTFGTSLGVGIASDSTFYKAGGSQPARFLFSADINGDTVDEIIVIKQQLAKGDRYRLNVHAAPQFLSHEFGPPVASVDKDSLGTPANMGSIVAASSIDSDGDLVDELLLVRQASNGKQRIEIRKLPKKKHVDLAPAFASYLDVGDALTDPIIGVGSLDIDGDGIEEVALLKPANGSRQLVVLVSPPLVPGDFSPSPIATLQFDVKHSGEILAVDGIDMQGDGSDELVLMREVGPTRRLEVFDNGVALAGGGEVPLSDQLANINLPGNLVVSTDSILTLRGFSPKDLPDDFSIGDLAGDVDCTLKFSVSQGYSGSENFTIGPFGGPHGETDGVDLDLILDGDEVISGPFDMASMTVGFALKQVTIHPGDVKLKVIFQPAKVFFLGKFVELRGSFQGTGVDGKGESFSVANGQYAFRRKLEG